MSEDVQAKWYIVRKTFDPPEDKKYHDLTYDHLYEPLTTEENVGFVSGVVPIKDDELEAIKLLPHVAEVKEDLPVSKEEVPVEISKEDFDEEVEANAMDAMRFLDVPDAWTAGAKGKDVTVAILDTGLDKTHAENTLSGRIKGLVSMVPDVSWEDLDGHGTHVAGTIAGKDGIGVAPECDLLIIKVLGNDGSGYTSWILKGMEYAAANGAQVINMSLGGSGGPNSALSEGVNTAFLKGVLVCCASGNDGCDSYTADPHSPGNAREAVAVAAVDVNGNIASFSSCGTVVDVAAVGVRVNSYGLNGQFNAVKSGTSMATPHAAGIAALMISGKSAVEVRAALYSTANNTALEPHKEGNGILRANAARQLLSPPQPEPTPDPAPEPTPDPVPEPTPEPEPHSKRIPVSGFSKVWRQHQGDKLTLYTGSGSKSRDLWTLEPTEEK